jgi:hypothetical protein
MTDRKPAKPAQDPGRDHWGLDVHDVRFHERRMRHAKAVGPLGKFFRGAAVVLVAAAAVWLYWNFETVSGLRFDFSRLTSAFSRDEAPGATGNGGEQGSAVVEGNRVAGVNMPTSLGGEAPAAASDEEPAAERPLDAAAAVQAELARAAAPTAAGTETAAGRRADEPRTAPPPAPEPPPGPETFGFGLSTMHVSESDASAAVLVLRDGDRRKVSTITWWTTNGTATAGTDFARLERRTERFASGEQNRTLHVPIVGDRNVEGPENFFVHLAAGDSANEIAMIEVIIDDDD